MFFKTMFPADIQYLSNNRLSFVTFSQDDIVKIIQNVDSDKAHGRENVNSCMLKTCGSTILKPLAITFKQCVVTGVFRSEWQKGHIVPIYKKGDKQTLKSYPPVSLLPTCGKILERLMFNEMLIFLLKIVLSRQTSLVLCQVILA